MDLGNMCATNTGTRTHTQSFPRMWAIVTINVGLTQACLNYSMVDSEREKDYSQVRLNILFRDNACAPVADLGGVLWVPWNPSLRAWLIII